jgi:hypothetical protein
MDGSPASGFGFWRIAGALISALGILRNEYHGIVGPVLATPVAVRRLSLYLRVELHRHRGLNYPWFAVDPIGLEAPPPHRLHRGTCQHIRPR